MPFFKPVSELCDPAKLYLVISIISILASLMTSNILGIVFHAISVILWAFLLGWICDQGYPGVSWFLVLALPVLMITILIMGLVFVFSRSHGQQSKILSNIISTQTNGNSPPTTTDNFPPTTTDNSKQIKAVDKEGMGINCGNNYSTSYLERTSITTPNQLNDTINGLMSIQTDAFSNPSNINDSFGPIL